MDPIYEKGIRLGSETTAAILLGCFIGFLMDKWLNLFPWGLIIGGGLGFAVGLRNVFKSYK